MDYSNYLNCLVKINISSGYYYKGKVLEVGEQQIKILDIKNKIVILNTSSIISCEEILDGS